MDKELLTKRSVALEIEFNSLRSKTDELRSQIEKNESELIKLQGRYAEVNELLGEFPPDEDQKLKAEAVLKENFAPSRGKSRVKKVETDGPTK